LQFPSAVGKFYSAAAIKLAKPLILLIGAFVALSENFTAPMQFLTKPLISRFGSFLALVNKEQLW
jgi:hypothetical protein